MMPKLLLVEDEAGLRLTLSDRLASEGYAVETASDGQSGFERAARGGYDLVVLDVMLPRMNGFDVCRELRRRGVETPILMLTARGQVVDKVVGLKLGADDYLTKPFEMPELVARLEALLRRRPSSAQPGGEAYRFGEVLVDFRSAEVTRAGQRIDLSPPEIKRSDPLLVRAVFDGDTIDVATYGHVRLLGIDAPEVGRGFDTSAPFGKEARDRLTALVLHRWVRLEEEGSALDAYDRRL